jgi:hypothetical protein
MNALACLFSSTENRSGVIFRTHVDLSEGAKAGIAPTCSLELHRSLLTASTGHRGRFFRTSQPIFNTYPIRIIEPDTLCQPVLPQLDTTMSNGSFIQLQLNSLQFFNSAHSQRNVIQADIFFVVR